MAFTKAQKIVSESMQAFCGAMDEHLIEKTGKRFGFTIVVWPEENNGEVSYVSNCSRQESMDGLKALLKHWESEAPDIPAHLKHMVDD
jgi:hypothetical protein